MARKSRKNIMPQSAAPEIRISEEVNLLRTAAYVIRRALEKYGA